MISTMSTMSTMSAIHAIGSSSNSPTDPLRHNLKANGYPQTNNKYSMAYSPLVLSNSPSVINNNSHINSDISNTVHNTSGLFSLKKHIKHIFLQWIAHSFSETRCPYFVSKRFPRPIYIVNIVLKSVSLLNLHTPFWIEEFFTILYVILFPHSKLNHIKSEEWDKFGKCWKKDFMWNFKFIQISA